MPSQRARARARERARARARTRPTHKERVHARARTRPTHKKRAHARTPRAPRVTSPHRARRASYARSWARAPPARGGGRGRMERGLESPVERKKIEKKREQLTPARLRRREPPATHAHITRIRVARTSPAPRSARARVARRGVGTKRRRNTRAMTDDGRNANILHHETRTLPTPLLVDRLLAAHEPASSARATPPRRPLARSVAGRGGGGVASCSALLLRPRWCGCRCGRR